MTPQLAAGVTSRRHTRGAAEHDCDAIGPPRHRIFRAAYRRISAEYMKAGRLCGAVSVLCCCGLDAAGSRREPFSFYSQPLLSDGRW